MAGFHKYIWPIGRREETSREGMLGGGDDDVISLYGEKSCESL